AGRREEEVGTLGRDAGQLNVAVVTEERLGLGAVRAGRPGLVDSPELAGGELGDLEHHSGAGERRECEEQRGEQGEAGARRRGQVGLQVASEETSPVSSLERRGGTGS